MCGLQTNLKLLLHAPTLRRKTLIRSIYSYNLLFSFVLSFCFPLYFFPCHHSPLFNHLFHLPSFFSGFLSSFHLQLLPSFFPCLLPSFFPCLLPPSVCFPSFLPCFFLLLPSFLFLCLSFVRSLTD